MATTDTLDAKSVKASDKKRAKSGHYIKTPNQDSLTARFRDLEEWFQDRNVEMVKHIKMSRLDNPFSTDKDGVENNEMRVKADGSLDYTIDNAPYNIVTIAQAMIAEMHPYADVFPTNSAHTEAKMREHKRFVQALLDTILKEGDISMDMANKLVVQGWLPTLTSFDPAKLKQGNNPFELRVLDPMNFYPSLNAQRQVQYGFYLERVTGAQLVQGYSGFDGVMELIEAEQTPNRGSTAWDTYNRYGNNLETTHFDIVRFYDDVNTALMISAAGAKGGACDFNPVLASRKKTSKGNNLTSLFYETGDLEDDPYLGLQKHGLGGVPFHLEGCFEEAMSPTARTNSDVGTMGTGNIYSGLMGGRMVYYPFLYPVYNDWIDRSRWRNMMHLGADAWARPTTVFYTENESYYRNTKQGDTLFMSPDGQEKREVEAARPMPPEFMAVFNEFGSSLKESTFAQSTFGGRVGNSARGQDAAMAQGSKRENVIIRKIQKSLANYCEMATRILIKRGGDEEVFVAGDGKAFGGGYTLQYQADALKGFVPSVEVELKLKNGLKDPMNVTAFSALQKSGSFADEFLMGRILDEPNPAAIIEQAIAEKARTEQTVIQPQIEVEAAKAAYKWLEEKYKWTSKVQLKEDKLEEELHHKQVEQDYEQLTQDEKDAKTQAAIDMVLQRAAMPPDSGSMPPNSSPPSMPSMPGQGPMPPPTPGPSGGLGGTSMTMQPNMPPPPMPSAAPSLPPRPMPGPPMMNAGPRPPMMPPPSMARPPMPGSPMGLQSGPPRPPMMPSSGPPSPGLSPTLPRPPMQGPGPQLPPGFAKAPGQAQRPVQPLSQFGMGRTGVPSALLGAAGLHGQMIDTPAFEDANRAFQPMDAPLASHGKKRKRGSRGSGKGGR